LFPNFLRSSFLQKKIREILVFFIFPSFPIIPSKEPLGLLQQEFHRITIHRNTWNMNIHSHVFFRLKCIGSRHFYYVFHAFHPN
jgi:hypothetical protein